MNNQMENQVPDGENKPNQPSSQSKKNKLIIPLVVVIVLLVLVNTAVAYWLYQEMKIKNVNQDGMANLNKNVNTNSGDNPDEDVNTNTADQDGLVKEGEVMVDWNDWPVKVPEYTLFDYQILAEKLSEDDLRGRTIEDFILSHDVYRVGKISQGSYVGQDLFIVTFRPEGPSFRDTMLRVIKTDTGLIHLSQYSDGIYGEYEKIFSSSEIRINNLETPNTIAIPNSSRILIKNKQEPFALLINYENPLKLFLYDGINYIYKDEIKNCFIIKASDGSVREYYFDLEFAGGAGNGGEFNGAVPFNLDFTLNNGQPNKNEYTFKSVGGCGFQGCYSYVDYITSLNQLTVIGQAPSGDKFYAIKDPNAKANQDAGQPILREMYDSYYPGYDAQIDGPSAKVSFEEFLVDQPIIYWQDPFGKFIEFRNAKYLPAVECGKPVIYLYPEQTTDVSVQVAPEGGFSVTEPAYNQGWFVQASPAGQLYNYSDGQIYPYLFWEGFGLNYVQPREGFVVAKGDVSQFLTEKLAQLGLVEHESAEFMEFWLPKMQDRNYYFITFVPQAEFDQLAPLNVSPTPDTIIRVFMDYQGLDSYVQIPQQQIITPERNGFTVVEWGGALHR